MVLYILKVFQVIQLFRNCIKLAINLLNEVNICNAVLQFQTESLFDGGFSRYQITRANCYQILQEKDPKREVCQIFKCAVR